MRSSSALGMRSILAGRKGLRTKSKWMTFGVWGVRRFCWFFRCCFPLPPIGDITQALAVDANRSCNSPRVNKVRLMGAFRRHRHHTIIIYAVDLSAIHAWCLYMCVAFNSSHTIDRSEYTRISAYALTYRNRYANIGEYSRSLERHSGGGTCSVWSEPLFGWDLYINIYIYSDRTQLYQFVWTPVLVCVYVWVP